MKMKILVGTDGSRYAEEAARFGALLAGYLDADLSLLTIAESVREEHQLARHAKQLSKSLSLDAQIPVNVRRGNPVREILRETQEQEIDLVVVGARGRDRVRRLFLGDTVHQLAEQITIPMVIVHRASEAIERILVCTAGGEHGRTDARYAASVAQAAEAEMTILHVMSQVPISRQAAVEQISQPYEWHLAHETAEGQHLAELLEISRQAEVQAEPKIRWGLVVDEILAEARDGGYDLVTVGAHQGQGFLRFLLDDVTEEIISRLDRPVLIVR